MLMLNAFLLWIFRLWTLSRFQSTLWKPHLCFYCLFIVLFTTVSKLDHSWFQLSRWILWRLHLKHLTYITFISIFTYNLLLKTDFSIHTSHLSSVILLISKSFHRFNLRCRWLPSWLLKSAHRFISYIMYSWLYIVW